MKIYYLVGFALWCAGLTLLFTDIDRVWITMMWALPSGMGARGCWDEFKGE